MSAYKLSAAVLNRKKAVGRVTDGAGLGFRRNGDGTLTAWQRVGVRDVKVRVIHGDITQSMLGEIRAEALKLKTLDVDAQPSMLFSAAWDHFLGRMKSAANAKWSAHTMMQAEARMANYVAGSDLWLMPVASITPDDVLAAVAPARERYPKLAPKVVALIGQVLASVAGKEGLATNAARVLKAELKSTERGVAFERLPAITEWPELGKLLYAIDNSRAQLGTRVALMLQAYSAQRTGEIVAAHWSEFAFQEDGSVIWTIPRARMKISDRNSKPYDQTLHLTKSVTKQLKRLPIDDGFVFKPRYGESEHLSVESLPTAFWKMGYKGIAVPHGWRSSLKTLAEDASDDDERPLFASSWIESVLDHSPKGVQAHYVRAKAERGMRRVLAWWAGQLDAALSAHEDALLKSAA